MKKFSRQIQNNSFKGEWVDIKYKFTSSEAENYYLTIKTFITNQGPREYYFTGGNGLLGLTPCPS